MKLRVRSAGRTERVNFDDNSSLATVKELVAQVFGYDVMHIDLSLNGRDVLSGQSDTPLSHFDIVSGDLLRIIVTHEGTAKQMSNQSLILKRLEAPLADETASQKVSCCRMEVDHQKEKKLDQGDKEQCTTCPVSEGNESRPSTSELRSYQTQEEDDDQLARSVQEPMLCRSATDCLIPQRLSALYTASKPQTLDEALCIVLHVLMLETGFHTEGTKEQGIPSDSLDTNAATTATSSFKKRATNLSCTLTMPVGWRDKGVCKLKYSHPSCEGAVCSLGCIPVGKFMVVHGITSCKSRYTLNVKAKDYVKAPDDRPMYTNLPQLSKLFKDSIAYPLLLATRSELGLVPLHGIQALFPEIQLLVLSFLDVKSLLNMSEVNQQFYCLAADRSLWRQLLLRDFTCKESENNQDWKELYKQKYKNKKDLERYQRSLIDRPVPVRRGMFYPPPPLPPTMPGYPPGYRGGDYDLDPFAGLRQPNTIPIRRDPTITPFPGHPDIVPFPNHSPNRDPVNNPIPRVPNSRGSRSGGSYRGFYF